MTGEERIRRHLHERLLEGMAMLERDRRTTRQAVDLLRADMELALAELRGAMTTGFERLRRHVRAAPRAGPAR